MVYNLRFGRPDKEIQISTLHNGRHWKTYCNSNTGEGHYTRSWSDQVQSTSSDNLGSVNNEKKSIVFQTAADIVHQVAKKLIELSVEGAKVIDLCIEGDKLIEQGTGAVYNKNVKGVKVLKGVFAFHILILGEKKTLQV